MSRAIGTIQIVHAQGTDRYALLGRVLCGGDIVQLCCSGGWLTGRFECDGGQSPTFYFTVEIEGGRAAQQAFALPDGAIMRWPA